MTSNHLERKKTHDVLFMNGYIVLRTISGASKLSDNFNSRSILHCAKSSKGLYLYSEKVLFPSDCMIVIDWLLPLLLRQPVFVLSF
jgi:hypothetical protein